VGRYTRRQGTLLFVGRILEDRGRLFVLFFALVLASFPLAVNKQPLLRGRDLICCISCENINENRLDAAMVSVRHFLPASGLRASPALGFLVSAMSSAAPLLPQPQCYTR